MIIPIHPINKFTTTYLVDVLDIEITPFSQCNLSCEFCCVKDQHTEFNEQFFDDTLNGLANLVVSSTCNQVDIHVAGGELFQDKFTEKQFDNYYKLFNGIKKIFEGKKLKIIIASNLIFKKRERVAKLIEAFKDVVELTTSFDLRYRFKHKKVVDLFVDNLYYFREIGFDLPIYIIATKVVHDHFVLNKDIDDQFGLVDTLHSLYNDNFDLILQRYDDFNNVTDLQISEKDYVQLLVWWVLNVKNSKTSRYYHHLHNSDQVFGGCSKENLDFNQNRVLVDCCDKKKAFADLWNAKNCMSCQYNHKCRVACPQELGYTSICPVREVFDAISEASEDR